MDRRILQNAVRNVLDGELLNRYLYLSTMERGELAKKIGTTPDIVSACCPSQPIPLCCPLVLTTLRPTDPGRLAGDRPCHRPLLASLMLPCPHALPPILTFVQNTRRTICLRRVCGHCIVRTTVYTRPCPPPHFRVRHPCHRPWPALSAEAGSPACPRLPCGHPGPRA